MMANNPHGEFLSLMGQGYSAVPGQNGIPFFCKNRQDRLYLPLCFLSAAAMSWVVGRRLPSRARLKIASRKSSRNEGSMIMYSIILFPIWLLMWVDTDRDGSIKTMWGGGQ